MTFPAKSRSWLTRGYFSPSPWGRTIPPLVAETEVKFYRITRTKNTSGGFAGGDPQAPYLTAMCHVELEETMPYRSAKAGSDSTAPMLTRHYVLLVPWDAFRGDPALVPNKGDRVRFTDALGNAVDMPINGTPDPVVNAQDHIELQTDEFI